MWYKGFPWKINYIRYFGACTIQDSVFKCKAWTIFGAWLKFMDFIDDEHIDKNQFNFFIMLGNIHLDWDTIFPEDSQYKRKNG